MPEARLRSDTDTASRILDVAERLVQRCGFNGFSYADVASELAVTKASVHYHFPSKGDLGVALMGRYAERFTAALVGIDRDRPTAPAKLEAYAALYADVLREERMCLCGMLAAEYETLPAPMHAAIVAFFDVNEHWLARVLEAGRDEASLAFGGSPSGAARIIISALEGALLVARPYGDLDRFDATVRQLFVSFLGVADESAR